MDKSIDIGAINAYYIYVELAIANYSEGRCLMRTLSDAKIGEKVNVARIKGEGAVRRRIMDMGITKDVEIFIRRMAPLGDPIEIRVRGYDLTLSKADAVMVEIE